MNARGHIYQNFGRGARTKDKNQSDPRLFFLIVILFLVGGAIILRLFQLQVVRGAFYSDLASGQHGIFEKLFPKRGEIYFSEKGSKNSAAPLGGVDEGKLYPAAINKEFTLVYAEPSKIADPKKTAKLIAPILGAKEEDLAAKLSRPEISYLPLLHRASDETVGQLKKLNLAGINFSTEIGRFWPEGEVGSQVLGFTRREDTGDVGQYGLEGYFDKELGGSQGYLNSERDPGGSLLALGKWDIKKSEDGSDLILTIDRNIEYFACDRLRATVKEFGAEKGTVIIMDPKTGAIMAMCSFPAFDPNNYADVKDFNLFNNPATFDAYEPGSIFKAITMAAALDAGKVNPDTTYTDEGSLKIDGHIIKNWDGKAHGLQTMTAVLEESLNTGAIFAERQIGNDVFRDYVSNFGFGALTGIELGAESAGNTNSLDKRGDIYSATASFGQGISVTPIQFITAFGALANGGELVKPYLVDEIVKSDGTKIKTSPQTIKRVISQRAATLIGGMLVSVVENGHGKRAGVPGYFVAGKTGTAQIAKKDGTGYEETATIGSFAGYAPVDDPKFVMLVRIDRPQGVGWSESTAAPLFGQIAKFLLNYLEVPPTR